MNRLFRADTPHDAVCAAIVAETLPPGRDVLALSADKGAGDSRLYVDRVRAMAALHRWSAVVDLSGLPVLQRPHDGGLRSAPARVRQLLDSMSFLRRGLAGAFDLDPASPGLAIELARAVDEVYLTCFHHPDMQAMLILFPRSRTAYLPHGFGSLHQAEIQHYARVCAPDARSPRPGERWRDRLKRWAWGPDAVPVRGLVVDAAYSFHLPAPWAREQHSLAHWLDRACMQRLFRMLPDEVQRYYDAMADSHGRTTGLLLLTPSYHGAGYRYDLELPGYLDLIRVLRDREGIRRLLVKPHPLTGAERLQALLAEFRAAFADLDVVPMDRFCEFPVEVVLAPFRLAAGAGIGSTSIRTLRMIYGLRNYCAEALMLRLEGTAATRLWIEEHRGDYIAV